MAKKGREAQTWAQPQLSHPIPSHISGCTTGARMQFWGGTWPYGAFCSCSQLQILNSRDRIKAMHQNQFGNTEQNKFKYLKMWPSFSVIGATSSSSCLNPWDKNTVHLLYVLHCSLPCKHPEARWQPCSHSAPHAARPATGSIARTCRGGAWSCSATWQMDTQRHKRLVGLLRSKATHHEANKKK